MPQEITVGYLQSYFWVQTGRSTNSAPAKADPEAKRLGHRRYASRLVFPSVDLSEAVGVIKA